MTSKQKRLVMREAVLFSSTTGLAREGECRGFLRSDEVGAADEVVVEEEEEEPESNGFDPERRGLLIPPESMGFFGGGAISGSCFSSRIAITVSIGVSLPSPEDKEPPTGVFSTLMGVSVLIVVVLAMKTSSSSLFSLSPVQAIFRGGAKPDDLDKPTLLFMFCFPSNTQDDTDNNEKRNQKNETEKERERFCLGL